MMMKVLSENAAAAGKFEYEHGLSIYVETDNHRLLWQ